MAYRVEPKRGYQSFFVAVTNSDLNFGPTGVIIPAANIGPIFFLTIPLCDSDILLVFWHMRLLDDNSKR